MCNQVRVRLGVLPFPALGLPARLCLLPPAMIGKAAPIPVQQPWGKPWGFDAVERERIMQATGVSIGFRQRPQWGPDHCLTASGPLAKIEGAMAMAKAV